MASLKKQQSKNWSFSKSVIHTINKARKWQKKEGRKWGNAMVWCGCVQLFSQGRNFYIEQNSRRSVN